MSRRKSIDPIYMASSVSEVLRVALDSERYQTVKMECRQDTGHSINGRRRIISFVPLKNGIKIYVEGVHGTTIDYKGNVRTKILNYLHGRNIFCSLA